MLAHVWKCATVTTVSKWLTPCNTQLGTKMCIIRIKNKKAGKIKDDRDLGYFSETGQE